jgi:pimeloyl-ACP methyl ester carboxylesterase
MTVRLEHGHSIAVLTRYAKSGGPPVLIVPGYGMNASIFAYHPSGPSLSQILSEAGHDVWTVDLRGQGAAKRKGSPVYGIAELALEDLPRAIAHVREATGREQIALVGCSLGTALVFTYIAHYGDKEISSVVTMAGLVTWRTIHPAIRAAFVSSRVAAAVPMRGLAQTAGVLLPVLARVGRRALSIYLNPETTDISNRAPLIETVEDPSPGLNRELAKWMRARELHVRDVNISKTLAEYKKPLLSVLALQDGIVSPETARHVFLRAGSADKTLIEVGTVERPVAHADLFLGRGMQSQVFEKAATFLRRVAPHH